MSSVQLCWDAQAPSLTNTRVFARVLPSDTEDWKLNAISSLLNDITNKKVDKTLWDAVKNIKKVVKMWREQTQIEREPDSKELSTFIRIPHQIAILQSNASAKDMVSDNSDKFRK
jgi:hypothetical protein